MLQETLQEKFRALHLLSSLMFDSKIFRYSIDDGAPVCFNDVIHLPQKLSTTFLDVGKYHHDRCPDN
ncbi:hypothetical protein TNCV_1685911 [Trichonephila clavipes]|nr:hypothetical protein TNCV_1685911 [Trichonephila clavipes]